MDHFEVLGLRRGASEGEITGAFRALAKKHHPDHGGDEKLFAQLVLARDAARSDAKKAPPAEVWAPVARTPRREPETRQGPVTVFRTSPSPFKFPKPGLSDFVSFFSAQL